jgi:hypothetical protein
MKKPALISVVAFLALMPITAQGGQNADSMQHYKSKAQQASQHFAHG